MRIAVIGAGFVGLTTAISLAESGHSIVVAEHDPDRLQLLQAGKPHFFEPGLNEALRAVSLEFVQSVPAAAAGAEACIICVGTPTVAGHADMTGVLAVAEELARVVEPGVVVAVKSTTPPGTTRNRIKPVLPNSIHVVCNPEFLQEGRALADSRAPSRIVIGADDPTAADAAWRIYEEHEAPRVTVDTATAELIKYASNAFLATKISFANELATLCHEVGADWSDVLSGMAPDPRINTKFMRPGPGFGGSCFPKDVEALAATMEGTGLQAPLLRGVLERNQIQPGWTVNLLEQLVGPLRNKRVALLGLSFKGNTDDVRATRALPLWQSLVAQGAIVACHDPRAASAFQALAPDAVVVDTINDALTDADACIVQAEHPEYRELGRDDFSVMANRVILDCRDALGDVGAVAVGDGHSSSSRRT